MRTVPILAAAVALATATGAHAQAPPDSVLELDFPGLRIGVAEDDAGPTGTTVFYFPDGVVAAADVRGGSPGTVNVPAVELGYEIPFIQAIVFSGGSWYGLSAATGVADGLKDARLAEDHDFIAGVLGGIVYDVGWRRFSRVTPDDALGRAALEAARPNRFPMGARGAGRFTMQGFYFLDPDSPDATATWAHSGQGGAFAESGPTRVAVFTVVNAMGAVVDRDGRVVRCHRNDPAVECPSIEAMLERALAARAGSGGRGWGGPTSNTTLTLVATNQRLSWADLKRLAVQVHTSMARAIQPLATEEDGDLLYAVTTNEVENPDLAPIDLGVLASELAWDAVLNSVPRLPEPPALSEGPADPSLTEGVEGDYAFPGGGVLSVTRDGAGLSARFSGNGRKYFEEGRDYRLLPAEGGVFVVDGAARDVVRFDREAGRVTGLTVNPDKWWMVAERVP